MPGASVSRRLSFHSKGCCDGHSQWPAAATQQSLAVVRGSGVCGDSGLRVGADVLAQDAPATPDVAKVAETARNGKIAGDTAWMLTSSALVLFMTAPGLAMFYGGLVRKKNVLGVMMQCVFLMGLMTVIWGAVRLQPGVRRQRQSEAEPVHRRNRLRVHERRGAQRGPKAATPVEPYSRPDGMLAALATCCSRGCSSSSRRR